MPVRERPGADERLVGGFREGMAVEYNSFSRGGWMPAYIGAVHRDGSLRLLAGPASGGPRSRTTVLKDRVHPAPHRVRHRRPRAPTIPTRRRGDDRSPYSAGQHVQYNSEKRGTWINCIVADVHRDGALTLDREDGLTHERADPARVRPRSLEREPPPHEERVGDRERRAVRNFERHRGWPPNTATLDQVQRSPEGVRGWASAAEPRGGATGAPPPRGDRGAERQRDGRRGVDVGNAGATRANVREYQPTHTPGGGGLRLDPVAGPSRLSAAEVQEAQGVCRRVMQTADRAAAEPWSRLRQAEHLLGQLLGGLQAIRVEPRHPDLATHVDTFVSWLQSEYVDTGGPREKRRAFQKRLEELATPRHFPSPDAQAAAGPGRDPGPPTDDRRPNEARLVISNHPIQVVNGPFERGGDGHGLRQPCSWVD